VRLIGICQTQDWQSKVIIKAKVINFNRQKIANEIQALLSSINRPLKIRLQINRANEIKIARVCIVIIFLALIRTISEILRLQHYSSSMLTYEQMKPFVVGALVASISLLAMTIFSFYGKHKIVIAISVLTIILLLIIKKIFLM
jgi:hypothetical protein